MAISRNLFLFIILNIACSVNAKGDTYITNQALPYDVITPKATIILNFAQEIYPPFSPSTTHKAMGEWLTKGIAQYLFDNITIITIANIIESNSTLETKITSLLIIKAEWDTQYARSRKLDSIITGTFFICFAAMLGLIFRDIITKSTTAQS